MDCGEAVKTLVGTSNKSSYTFLSGNEVWKIYKKRFLALYEARKQKEKLFDLLKQAKEMKIKITDDKLKDHFMIKTEKLPNLF